MVDTTLLKKNNIELTRSFDKSLKSLSARFIHFLATNRISDVKKNADPVKK